MSNNSGGPSPRARRVVVTGIGVVNPLATGTEPFWEAVLAKKTAIGAISRFDADGLPVHLSAEVAGFRATDHVPRRLVVKSDLFAHYAMAAAGQALADASFDTEPFDPFRTGISFGNNSGGWELCERGFREYYQQHPTMINPWQATAWFPTAAQGFVSIRYGIRGFSKSFAADRASGACGLLHGMRSILRGRNDVVLAGGAEAPLTRLGMAAHVTTGDLSRASAAEDGYLPFDGERAGLVLGEGATVLVLEEREHALRRGARVLGELASAEQRTAAPDEPDGAAAALTAALHAADRAPQDVDVVFAEGAGSAESDATEARALARVFGEGCVPVTVPKAGYGHQYGASAATELVCAALSLRDGALPPTPGTRTVDERCAVDLVTETRPRAVSTTVVHSRSREGTNVAMVLTAPDRHDRRVA
ncbi:ketosynthase chain-length factor [Streptomyces sp. BHT-5-2]|uniref:beta-ketoacyl synthase N-terminal-like domain-containing protein n=1 Tax=Streptomyces sp. BHT-5-2 TaxID=2866715 RepID=UPI001C8DE04F|nr:beta-ketoacyl synthase N-terminal-like domain-containing protein [Streptomyces sp. BHT-5-2]QZL06396.1 ketosynthase chain-length factor [Streptomyces sp. BHT-5-2]